MKKLKYLFIPTTLIILLLLSVTSGYARGTVITANVDRATLTTDDTLTLTITVSADAMNAPNPVLPAMQGFNIVGRGSSSQISIINGAMSAQVIYSYYLQPYEVGNLVIDPISVTLNGQTFYTDPITVQVSQGTGNPTAPSPSGSGSPNPTAPQSTEFAGQKVFAEAEINNPTPYLGEQVIYTFRLYQAMGVFDAFSQPQYEAPPFTGFWVENTEQSQYQVQAGRRIYDVVEIRSTLFPSVMGPVNIEPARLIIPGGFFSRGGEVRTEPVTVDVQPLPAGAPASFNGAVGQFTLNATVDTPQSRVNEPITWQVTLSGWGNLNSMADPVWPEMADWRSFESQATINTQFQDGRVAGNRIYERLLVPQTEGEFVIPALEYTYFDPTSGAYQTISTQPIPVSIAPGDPAATVQPVKAPLPGVAKENVEQLVTDIRYLKPVPTDLSVDDRPITGSGLYWMAWGVPLLGLIGNFIWQRRQHYWQNNANLARSSKAFKKAKKALVQARREKEEVYNAAGQVLTDYLADKLGQPVAGLTRQALATLLAEKTVTAKLIERVEVCLADAELGRFSPDANNPARAKNLLNEIGVLLRDLEKTL